MASVCSSCGARIDADADRCPLCGTPVSAEHPPGGGRESTDSDSSTSPLRACPECGSSNPSGARFCNQCGGRIASEETPGSTRSVRPEEIGETGRSTDAVGRGGASEEETNGAGGPDLSEEAGEGGMIRRMLWVIGIGIALVAGLYGITAWSGGPGSTGGGTSPTGGGGGTASAGGGAGTAGGGAVGSGVGSGGTAGSEGGAAGNLAAGTRQRVDSLRTAVEQAASREEARKLREELVRVFVHAGRYDRAGEVQEAVAEQLGTAEAWARAGNYYYDWMMKVSGAVRTQYAKRAISTYQRSLEIDPDDLNVRTDMAVAYLYDPDNPMQAIKQTNQVLEQDPDHVQANFNKGIMLMQIGRTGQAADQFRKVMEITPDTGRVHRRAQQALQRAQSP